MRGRSLLTAACAVWLSAVAGAQLRDTFFDALGHPTIQYFTPPTDDPVSRLDSRIAAGEVTLAFDPRTGYLPSLLEALKVPVESQIVVFSKTSLQSPRVSPDNPRTIFFNDSVVVAWPRGGFIEMAAEDARQGVAFYKLEPRSDGAPYLTRPAECVRCHHSYATLGVPGPLVRSVATGPDGRTVPWLGNYTSDHTSPLDERWGGWYVTGKLGPFKHLGNAFVTASPANPDSATTTSFPPPESLVGRFDTSAYLSPYSDVVALLVFDHQMRMMNLLTRAGWDVRLAASTSGGDPARVARENAKEFVDYLLFVDEAPLPGTIRGSSGFAEQFSARGPKDRRGRSLRDLDLERRLFRYPCSYMIYSPAFDGLPQQAKDAIYRRLWEVLSGQDADGRYQRLSASDRQSIVEILRDTRPGLPDYPVSGKP